jgi:hypothetical protein
LKSGTFFSKLFVQTRSLLNAARITIRGIWTSCSNISVQLEKIIVKDKKQQTASVKVYGANQNRYILYDLLEKWPLLHIHSDYTNKSKLAH